MSDVLASTLEQLANEVVSGANNGNLLFHAYQRWARQTIERLRPYLLSGEVASLIQTPGYWALQPASLAVSAQPANLENQIHTEAGGRELALEDLLADVAAAIEWKRHLGDADLVSPDTNVLLHYGHDTKANEAATFVELPWRDLIRQKSHVRVLLTHQVIDEIDDLKRTARSTANDRDNPKSRARSNAFKVEELFYEPNSVRAIGTQSSAELVLDDNAHLRLPSSDGEIVARLALVKQIVNQPVYLLTLDAGMAARARISGLDAVLLR